MRPALSEAATLGLLLAMEVGALAAEVIVRDEIFGSEAAAQMVMQARGFDPRSAGPANADRDKAVALYEKAMALQPGAKINALLANRIAELYGYYGNRQKGIYPDHAKALQWWTRCLEETNNKQILWAEAHMGIACMRVLAGKPRDSADDFRTILNLDVIGVEWPQWNVKPDTMTAAGRERYEREMIRLRDRAEELHVNAVEKIEYVLVRVDGAAAVSTLLGIAKEYKGLPAGDRAAELAQAVLKRPGASAYRYRDTEGAIKRELPGAVKRPTAGATTGETVVAGPSSSAPPPRAPATTPAEPKQAPKPSGREEPETESTSPTYLVRRGGFILLVAGAVVLVAALVFVARRARARRRRT